MSYPTYQVLQVTRPVDHVVHVELNRPDKSNAMDGAFIRCSGPLQQQRVAYVGQAHYPDQGKFHNCDVLGHLDNNLT